MIESILAFALLSVAQDTGALREADAGLDPRTLDIEELRALRGVPAALSELESREPFSRRELRMIRRQRIRNGIGERALFCLQGEPADAIAVNVPRGRYPINVSGCPRRVDADDHASGTLCDISRRRH